MKKLSKVELKTLESLLQRAILNEQDFPSDVPITLGKKPLSQSFEEALTAEITNTAQGLPVPKNKYQRVIQNAEGCAMIIDVYDVLQAFQVTDPALQHLVKKALAAGQRGHKDEAQDLKDIVVSGERAIQLHKNRIATE